jgi:hypothetical protein
MVFTNVINPECGVGRYLSCRLYRCSVVICGLVSITLLAPERVVTKERCYQFRNHSFWWLVGEFGAHLKLMKKVS